MRILTVVGTRPQLIKAAAVQPALRAVHEEIFVDTGQHYDDDMAGNFIGELGLARPDHVLGIGGGGHAEQIGRMLIELGPIVERVQPDVVMVYGDTNSTLAGALTGAKAGIAIAHVEAGLRSFDRSMPEELNRVVVDHLSTWLFAPNAVAVRNLKAEGITRGVFRVGDVLEDLFARTINNLDLPAVNAELSKRAGLEQSTIEQGNYLLATVHRASNRDPATLAQLCTLFSELARPDRPVIFPAHPGTISAIASAGLTLGQNVRVIRPVGYRMILALILQARAVLTDSGGIQRESMWLATPCLILRKTTEWANWHNRLPDSAMLVGGDPASTNEQLDVLAPQRLTTKRLRRRLSRLPLEVPGAAMAVVSTLPLGVQVRTDAS